MIKFPFPPFPSPSQSAKWARLLTAGFCGGYLVKGQRYKGENHLFPSLLGTMMMPLRRFYAKKRPIGLVYQNIENVAIQRSREGKQDGHIAVLTPSVYFSLFTIAEVRLHFSGVIICLCPIWIYNVCWVMCQVFSSPLLSFPFQLSPFLLPLIFVKLHVKPLKIFVDQFYKKASSFQY